MPFFRWYPPLAYYLMAIIVIPTGLSLQSSLMIAFLLSMISGAIATYACVSALTGRDRTASLVGGVSYGSAYMLWNYAVGGGIYARIISHAFVPLSLLFVIEYLKTPAGSRRASLFELLSALSLFLAVFGHIWDGLEAAVIFLLVSVFFLRSRFHKAGGLFKIGVFSALLSAFFVLPFVGSAANMGFGSYVGTSMSSSLPSNALTPRSALMLLAFLTVQNAYGTLTFPIVAAFAIIVLLSPLKRRSIVSFGLTSRVCWALAVFAGLSIAYYYAGGDTVFLHIFPIVPFSILLGVLLHKILPTTAGVKFAIKPPRLSRLLAPLFLLVLVLSTFTMVYPVGRLSATIKQSNSPSVLYGYAAAHELLKGQPSSIADYRFGIPSDSVAAWFNSEFPNIPQTRQYDPISVLNKDFVYWFELSVWGGMKNGAPYTGSPYETKFLLDWFAVKWFLLYPPFDVTKFGSDPSFHQVVSAVGGQPSGFIFDESTPIVTCTTAPAVLVVGDRSAFDTLFRSLSYSQYDSRSLIPVYGGKYVDDLSSAQLAHFSAIVLYGYDYHNQQKAYSILAEYVNNGGGLYLETGLSPESTSPQLPEPSPVGEVLATDFGTTWRLTNADSPLFGGVRFNAFSPPIYSGNIPWGVSASKNESVRSWGSTIVWDSGRPLIVAGQHGKGRVIWSGMNLPYHADSYENEDESRLIGNLITWIAAPGQVTWSDESVARTDPQHVTIEINSDTGGVLLKEFYFPGWRAFTSNGNDKREVPIYLAGPGFMYISARDAAFVPGNILVEFDPTAVVLAGDVISIITAAFLIMYVILPGGRKLRLPRTGVIHRVRSWWLSD